MSGHQRADELSTCLIVVALTDIFRGIFSYPLINMDTRSWKNNPFWRINAANSRPYIVHRELYKSLLFSIRSLILSIGFA